MKWRLIVAALLVAGVVATGCRTTSIQNVHASPLVPPASMSDAELLEAIQSAGTRRGWVIRPVGPDELEGHLRVRRRHVAVVSITYDRTQFSIRYKDSENLRYDGTRIHRNYNRWVLNLERDIRVAVSERPRED
jgi:hypothetical protein